MNYLFELTHPKHYYQFKYSIKNLSEDKEHSVFVIARDKDVLLDILREEKVPFSIYGEHKRNLFSKFLVVPSILFNYVKIVKKLKIDVIVSKASPYAAVVGIFLSVKTIITPDSEVVHLTNRFVAPLSNLVITPKCFEIDFNKKHKKIEGFFEDCYLHPEVFKPELSLIEKLGFKRDERYFILRFIGWNANHDLNNYGFSPDEKMYLVEKLEKYGHVYISSEEELNPKLTKKKIKIPPSLIHHVLHFADLYIGDSQTMATESALLGTPSIRYNSFVGENDMSNFKALENEHDLLRNCDSFEKAISLIDEYLGSSEIKNQWLRKRETYYSITENSNKKLLSLISNL